VLFVIVPAERRVECYDSLYEAGGFHYESLSVIIRFLKDYQVLNNLPVDDWTWSVKIVCEPKQNNLINCGVFVCIQMYCMMKCWDLNSIPVDAYNSRLRLFIAYSMLKWDISTKGYSFSPIPAPLDNAFRLPYDGATRIFYQCLYNHLYFLILKKSSEIPVHNRPMSLASFPQKGHLHAVLYFLFSFLFLEACLIWPSPFVHGAFVLHHIYPCHELPLQRSIHCPTHRQTQFEHHCHKSVLVNIHISVGSQKTYFFAASPG
jgi:hypothetical protein